MECVARTKLPINHCAEMLTQTLRSVLALEPCLPYAIWADEQVVGFALIDIDEDIQQYMLWRFMIGQEFQGKGYGQAALEVVIAMAQSHPVCDHLIAAYVKGNQKMAHLLEKNDFVLDSEEERELVFRLETPDVQI
ncbi:histone acetyltransferase HPA2-like acetyltransferase [Streptococcus suis]|uniref:GNAT family N-acetyltransferase n=1 Tax=Streptococcus suis TaxID=1307 RepID=UPI00076995A4|nr:GNAT family N-acetyltransferase [Streptococcus suis]CYV82390.1 histone acetyltransferase HPA2-like acetyltransferase [Streptococcus suis]